MKTKTIRGVTPIIRDVNGKRILDVLTWKFIGMRESQALSEIEFFIEHRVERCGWECGRSVFCGKFEKDRLAIEFNQDDLDSWRQSKPSISA